MPYFRIKPKTNCMHINIRKGNESDFEQLKTLFAEFATFQQMPDKMTNSIELMRQEKEYFNCFVAEDSANNKIIGYASYFFAYYTWIGKSLYIDDIYVQEKYRKNGIGKRLIERVFELAKNENCKKVRWQVSNWNKNAIEFYQKLGASVDGVELNCDFPLKH